MNFITTVLILLSITFGTTPISASSLLCGHAGDKKRSHQIHRTLDLDEQDQPKDLPEQLGQPKDLPEQLGDSEPPSNDKCANAQDLGLLKAGSSMEVTGSTKFATVADLENLACNILDNYDPSKPTQLDAANTPSVWYTFQVEDAMVVTISLCGSSYDTQLAIFPGHVCAAEESSSMDECSAFDDDTGDCPAAGFSDVGSRIAGHPVSPGATNLVLITGFRGRKGDFVMDLSAA